MKASSYGCVSRKWLWLITTLIKIDMETWILKFVLLAQVSSTGGCLVCRNMFLEKTAHVCLCAYIGHAHLHPPSAWGRFEHCGSNEALALPIWQVEICPHHWLHLICTWSPLSVTSKKEARGGVLCVLFLNTRGYSNTELNWQCKEVLWKI